MTLTPPFAYFGGKTLLATRIAGLLPPHRHYVEPFAGSLAVLLAKRPAPMETINDLDRDVMCVGPDTRILTSDCRWVRAGDVAEGDELIGFDEHNGPAAPGLRAPTRYRHWRTTEVEAVTPVTKPAYRLTFDDGTTVVASADHMWLSGSHATGGRGWQWKRTEGLVCNRATQRSWVLKLLDVDEREDSREAGWLAGFYDGEGNVISAGVRQAGWRLTVSQKLGPEADYCERLLRERGFEVARSVSDREHKGWQKVATLGVNGGGREVMRFLTRIGPQRLIRDFVTRCLPNASLYGRSRQAVGLVSKEYLGEVEVMAIQTTSRTYVAEGLASHNCFWQVLRDHPADLARVCFLTPHSRAEHDQSFDRPDTLSDLERARRVWVRLTQGRGGMLRRTGWRHYGDPHGGSGMPDYLAAYSRRILPAAHRLAQVSLE